MFLFNWSLTPIVPQLFPPIVPKLKLAVENCCLLLVACCLLLVAWHIGLQAHFFCNDAALNFIRTTPDHGMFGLAKVAFHVLLRQLRVTAQGLHAVE